MALLGNAAMMLWYDIIPDQIADHDEWHTREHFPERVAIPGFLRAQRWVSDAVGPRYFVVYEVSDVGVLSGVPYMERLNNPTPWTSRVMPHFRGMSRGFCKVISRHGTVLGTSAVSVRFSIVPGEESRMLAWLERAKIPDILKRKGFASAFVLKSDAVPEMTAEQRIRGKDANVDWVLLITGHSREDVKSSLENELSADEFRARGATSDFAASFIELACLSSNA
jgi:hypothetical protein